MSTQVWYDPKDEKAFGAAWVCRKWFSEFRREEKLQYGNLRTSTYPFYDRQTLIYIIDSRFTQEQKEKLKSLVLQVHYLEATRAWVNFFSSNIPVFLRYLNNETQPYLDYIRIKERTFEAWDILYAEFETDLGRVLTKATAIQEYIQSQYRFSRKESQSQ